jgi:translation initiation factor 2 beta subunit (eIF-2beta)/eIF-5
MNSIPIPNNSHTARDPSYRYKRDMLVISKSGKHFVIDNLDTVCTQTKINKADIIKFMPKHFKQPIKMFCDKVGVKVNSTEATEAIENMLETYIVNNIICSNCAYPELEMNKTSDNYMVCNSCGHNMSKSVGSSEFADLSGSDKMAESGNLTVSGKNKTKKSATEQKKEVRLAKKLAISMTREAKKEKRSYVDGDSDSE